MLVLPLGSFAPFLTHSQSGSDTYVLRLDQVIKKQREALQDEEEQKKIQKGDIWTSWTFSWVFG